MKDRSSPRLGPLVYDVVVSVAAGFSLGFFAWIVVDRLGDGGIPPMWPFAAGGIVLTFLTVRWVRHQGSGRWIHLLWVPVLVFVALMTMIVLALRSFT